MSYYDDISFDFIDDGRTDIEREKFIDDLLLATDLDGIECFHPSANEEETKTLIDYARKNNLFIRIILS